MSDKFDPTAPAPPPTDPPPTPRRKPTRIPETGEHPEDLDWGNPRALAWEAARQGFLKGNVDGTYEDAALVADIVTENLVDQVPGLKFFVSNDIEPGGNSDVEVTTSLNGRLLRITRNNGNTGEERYGLTWTEFDNLMGRLLTLCDATFTDATQRKAFKDMVRQHVKEWVTACIIEAASDAGLPMNLTAPFTGGIPDEVLFGVEGQPTK